jgi:cyclophilin family peptidyl-prolyl cis-trans isomerase
MRETVVAALRDADANVRVAAAEAAAPLVGRDDARAWAPLWDADTSFAVRRALLAVEAPRPAALLARAGEWARDPDWRRRAAAARALLPAGGDPRPLAPLVADPDARVRAAAYGALGDALDSAVAQPELRAALLRGVGDTDAIVRGTAIGALAARPSVVELPTVRAAYDAAAGDRDNDARLAALRYLARLWEATGARVPAGDRARLFELPAIADPLELAAATGLPGVPASPPRMPAPRPASYYRAVAADLLVPAIRGAPAPRVVVRTVRGDLTLALHASDAPLTVRNFLDLVERGYYAGTRFHRVVPGFVTQDGDPRGDGNGGPGYAIRDEQNRRRYARGAVGMALSGPNTGGSQYFVTLTRQPHLDGHYTVFGRLVAGAESLDGLVQGDSIFDVRVVR